MCVLNTYLTNLRNKVFKLLPMREVHDKGINSHLDEYLDNLYANFAGAFDCYPELADMREIVEVYNNIAFLNSHKDLDFVKWRSCILRSTRLIQAVITRYKEV